MKFLFIDESEKQQNKRKYFFSLSGLLVNKDSLINLENELREQKIRCGFKNFKELKKIKQKEEKLKYTNEIVKILLKHDVKVLSSVLGSLALRNIEKVDNSYFEALIFLIERFYIHLKKDNKIGIIIHDSVSKNIENNLRKEINQYLIKSQFEMYGKSKGFYKERIYPSLFFSKDEYSEILQISDLIATSLNSAVWKIVNSQKDFNPNLLPNYNEYLKIYWPLFVKNPKDGKVNGWGIKVWW